MTTTPGSFLKTLDGEVLSTPPIWFMRQAGRYLPEYRAVREEAGGFLDLCYNPEKAARVTLQPIERYDLDAAILFADILLIPQALGMKLWFGAGEGPRLSPPLLENPDLSGYDIDKIDETLGPVYETVRSVRRQLPTDKALIGFAGAPWTVATYMIAGAGSKDPSALRLFAYQNPETFDHLMEILVDATVHYLCKQVEAGADALQLFDSWASGLPEGFFQTACVAPVRAIAERVKAIHPHIPFIAFPRACGPLYDHVAQLDAVDAVSLDTGMATRYARENLAPHVVLQGGLDPLRLVEGGQPMLEAARRLLSAYEGLSFVFNTGHGLVPQVPPEHVGRLVEAIRSGELMEEA